MAELVGLAASIATLAELAGHVKKFVQTYRNAPAEIFALKTELIGLEFVFAQVEEVCTQDPTCARQLEPALNEVDAVFDKISTMAITLMSSAKLSPLDKLKWMTAEKSKVGDLVNRLKDIRARLDTLLAARTVATGHNTRLVVDQIHSGVTQLMQHTQSATVIEKGVNEVRGHSEIIQANTTQLVQRTETVGTQMEQIQTKLHQISNQLSVVYTTNLDMARGNILSVDYNLATQNTSLQEPVQTLALTNQSFHESVRSLLHARSGPTRTVQCTCQCHKTVCLRTPQAFLSFLGTIDLSFRNILRKCVCAESRCKAASNVQRLQVTYTFPPARVKAALAFRYSYQTFGDPLAMVTVQNVHPYFSPIIEMVETGDIEGLKMAFAEGRARPNDVDDHGFPLMHQALMKHQFSTCAFLMACGVDMSCTDRLGATATDTAWEEIYFRSKPGLRDIAASHLPSLLNFSPQLDWQFTRLHELIFTPNAHNTLEQILSTGIDVNIVDTYGRTPLWWAAVLGDATSTRMLIEAGADPKAGDYYGLTALHGAFMRWYANTEVVQLLIEHGASVTVPDIYGRTCWHMAADSHIKVMELIIGLVPDINILDHNGETALMSAVRADFDDITRLLLDHGADPNIAESTYGLTALHIAIQEHAYDSIPVLLEYGADYYAVDKEKWTMLMHACNIGDAYTAMVLSSCGIGKGLDALAQDVDGDTIFSETYTHDWGDDVDEFLRLIASGHCTQCTEDAKNKYGAEPGGCPHGVLKEIGLEEYVNALPCYRIHEVFDEGSDEDDEWEDESDDEDEEWEDESDIESETSTLYDGDHTIERNSNKNESSARAKTTNTGIPHCNRIEPEEEDDEFFDAIERRNTDTSSGI